MGSRERSVLRTRAVHPGPGSMRLLAWLGRLGIAGVEPLALALGLHQRTVYSHVERLLSAGLVQRPLTGDGEGGVVVITRAGAREALDRGAQGLVSSRISASSSARHGRAVSWVAASAEVRGWRWLGPAELRKDSGWRVQRDDGARHAPDLGLVQDGGHRIAVEVELHAKAPKRVEAILRGYRGLIDQGALSAVSYVIDRDDVGALIRRQAELALLGQALHVGPLSAVVGNARRGASA